MKDSFIPLLFVGAIITLALYSCQGWRTNKTLHEIESYLQDAPDSALQALSAIEPLPTASQKLKAQYSLLYSIALDKNFIDSVNDSLARVAVDYYSNTNDAYHRMLAWYSLGRVQFNAHNYARAIISLTEAEKDAQNRKDYHYLGLIYRNIGELFSICYDSERSLSYLQESSSCFLRIGEKKYSAYSDLMVARKMNDLHRTQERDSVLDQVTEYASHHDSYLLGEAQKTQALYLMQPPLTTNHVRTALELFKGYIRYQGKNASANVYATMALAYTYLSKSDSADYYLKTASKRIRTQLDSVQTWSIQYRIASLKGDQDSAAKCLKKAMETQNRIIFNRENLAIANSLSDYYAQQARRESEVSYYHRRMAGLGLCIILLLAISLVLSLKFYRDRLKKKAAALREREEQIQEDIIRTNEIMKELETIRASQSTLLTNVNRLIKEKIAIIQLWSDAYLKAHAEEKIDPTDPYRYLDEDADNEKEDNMKAFITSLEALRHDKALFEELEGNVNQRKQGIMQLFRDECPNANMDEKDYMISLLSFAELSDKAIAYLVNMTAGAVRTRKTRIRTTLRSSSAPHRNVFLNEL